MKLKMPIVIIFILVQFINIFAQDTLSKQYLVKNYEVFGTKQITIETIEQKLGNHLQQLTEAYEKNNKQLIDSLRNYIAYKIEQLGNFAFVSVSAIRYFSNGKPVYITIDIVDVADKTKRMPFIPLPNDSFIDPDSLLFYWQRYAEIGQPLMENNKIDFSLPCPAFHCLYGFGSLELLPFGKRFSKFVPINKDRLVTILKKDKDPNKRATAAYLLAHLIDGNELVSILLGSINDASSLVRNNVMRVLSEIAMRYPEIQIPLDLIINAINYPSTSDRNKALAVLFSLAGSKKNVPVIKEKAGQILINLLKLKQPNNHLPAYFILKKISDQDFGETNYEAWSRLISKKTFIDMMCYFYKLYVIHFM